MCQKGCKHINNPGSWWSVPSRVLTLISFFKNAAKKTPKVIKCCVLKSKSHRFVPSIVRRVCWLSPFIISLICTSVEASLNLFSRWLGTFLERFTQLCFWHQQTIHHWASLGDSRCRLKHTGLFVVTCIARPNPIYTELRQTDVFNSS